jgi:pimeloyl-ACP methyl ester carboxylesterase
MPGWLAAQDHPDRLAALVSIECPPPRGELTRPIPPRPAHPLPFDWAVIESVIEQINHPQPEWWDRLVEIQIPALVVAGGPESDVPQDLMAQVAAAVPGAQLVTIAGGHHLHQSRSDEFVAALQAFLADVGKADQTV